MANNIDYTQVSVNGVDEEEGSKYCKYPTSPYCWGALLERFESMARDSDIFINTSAKCGQTWLQTLLYHLKTEGKCPDLEGKELYQVVPWLEVPINHSQSSKPYEIESRLNEFEQISNPRIFKMHVLWDEIPRPLAPQSKVIVITRDVRDVPYSMYQHHQTLTEKSDLFKNGEPPTFEEYFDSWLLSGPYYFKHLSSVWPHRNDPCAYFLTYEKLKADTWGETKKLLKFLQWNICDDDVRRAIDLASFANMRKAEKFILFQGNAFEKEKHFIREGQVGKNRLRLTEDMVRRLAEKGREFGLDDDAMELAFGQGGLEAELAL